MEPNKIYQPLNPAQREIRLLHVLPKHLFSHRPQDIFCTIKTTNLDDAADQYKALSYAWGKEVSRHQVYLYINGTEIPITVQENLYQALIHLRDRHQGRSDGPFVLWVDAICINQGDENEKTEQVKHMKSVYEKASAVCVWLGVAADGSDQLIKRMRDVCEMAMGLERAVPGSWTDVMSKVVTSSEEDATFALAAMVPFLSRPWWSRIWVVQEIAAATTVHFYCGHRRITDLEMHVSVACFLSMLDTCSTKPLSTRSEYECQAALMRDFSIRMSIVNELPSIRAGLEPGFLRLIDRLRQWYMTDPSRGTVMEASDARDFVFSLLGICRDAAELQLQPDYTKSWEDVFIDTAAAILETGDMGILSLAQGPVKKSSLPSWVPDWGSFINHTLQHGPWHISQTVSDFFADMGSLDLRPYMTSHGMKQKLRVTRDSHRGPFLTISATALDSVREVIGQTPPSNSAFENTLQFWRSIFTATQNSSRVNKQYEDLSSEVFRLLTLDRERVDREGLWTICRARNTYFESAKRAYNLWAYRHSYTIPAEFLQELEMDENLSRFRVTSSTVAAGMQAFVTDKGWIGLGPGGMTPGDVVTIIAGADVPFLLRIDDQGHYNLVGETHVQGIIDGEAVEMGLPVVDIDLY